MEDASKLQGYLMKEKSKLSRLHGLTGDINKRYFKIQSIEVSSFCNLSVKSAFILSYGTAACILHLQCSLLLCGHEHLGVLTYQVDNKLYTKHRKERPLRYVEIVLLGSIEE